MEYNNNALVKGKVKRYEKAKSFRDNWVPLFEECYEYALPMRESFYYEEAGQRRDDRIFDETAVVGVQEFASRLQSGLVPNFARWADLTSGSEVPSHVFGRVRFDPSSSSAFLISSLRCDVVTWLLSGRNMGAQWLLRLCRSFGHQGLSVVTTTGGPGPVSFHLSAALFRRTASPRVMAMLTLRIWWRGKDSNLHGNKPTTGLQPGTLPNGCPLRMDCLKCIQLFSVDLVAAARGDFIGHPAADPERHDVESVAWLD